MRWQDAPVSMMNFRCFPTVRYASPLSSAYGRTGAARTKIGGVVSCVEVCDDEEESCAESVDCDGVFEYADRNSCAFIWSGCLNTSSYHCILDSRVFRGTPPTSSAPASASPSAS